MKPEPWIKIEEMFQAALSRSAVRCTEFLREMCRDDLELREVVECPRCPYVSKACLASVSITCT